MEPITTKYISIILTFLFVFATNSLQAQKRYDCTVYVKEGTQSLKIVGQLSAISDSGVIIRTSDVENSVSWKDLHLIRFKKHNGFSRTALPLIIAGSAAITGAVEINKSKFIDPPPTTFTNIAVNTVAAAIPGIIIFFCN
ncbi:MAG: hypothetical protein V4450_00115 [Bacteroidota bacterium]